LDLPTVSPGEVEDRYRNKGPLQGIGYPLFALEGLVNVAEILRGASFDYCGRRGQSIDAALLCMSGQERRCRQNH
jgi:hypothetical protein